ncbi:DNA phosphorothioation system sulfurtransferase DndC [Colwellia sp. Bg11-28]|uniref:DNA phosphorothioation system sulfurtransferase DndC n=1 Tax=Colwellia sp. Bg11-28 TaxID=2058305 RepID=UPI001E507CD6|nr:DNA phosphorothioation system sulfurtransferase DndC [Colwellia sp. Bg11-28]
MSNIFQADNLDDEQLDYVNNEFFSGFKRYKNWKTLPPKLKDHLPKYMSEKVLLRSKVEENTLKLKSLINIVYSLFSEIPKNSKVTDNMEKLSEINKLHFKKSPLNEQQKKAISAYLALVNKSKTDSFSSISNVYKHLEQQHQNALNAELHLRQAENTLSLCVNLINQYIDDLEGIRYKKVKRTPDEIEKDAKENNILPSEVDEYKDVRIVLNAQECQKYLDKLIFQNGKIADYEPHLSQRLIDIIHRVQSAYTLDNRPWVIGYSGGKDSSAVATLIYLSVLALEKEKRTKNIYLVASDTLVETPKVVDHIDNSLAAIHKQAKLDQLPISTHKVMPEANQSFWACLLGKGYPAPTQSFRWCTERMKINPVSDFIKSKISQHDEVIVTLGSRSEESASRAQVIAKHKIENSRFARHTTLANAYIYTPIDTWSMDDVWKILRACSLEVTTSPLGIGKKWADKYDLEWQNPWASKNLTLWNLYKDASDQGECPMVIDDSTPSCGNSRFGCWTCTVVTRDRAMESLIQNGEAWMEPLLIGRNILAKTNIITNKDRYRNYKRRIGRVNFQRAKDGDDISLERAHVPGPYWLKYRKRWLRKLLVQEKQFNKAGHKVELITKPELHAIRQEWLNDPNEPDWDDSLPGIYRSVYGKDLNWVYNDNSTFDKQGAHILTELGQQHNVVPQMVMKLLDLEISMEGLSRRSGVQNKVATILKQDWGTLEEIKDKLHDQQSRAGYDVFQEEISSLNDKLATVEALLKKEF